MAQIKKAKMQAEFHTDFSWPRDNYTLRPKQIMEITDDPVCCNINSIVGSGTTVIVKGEILVNNMPHPMWHDQNKSNYGEEWENKIRVISKEEMLKYFYVV